MGSHEVDESGPEPLARIFLRPVGSALPLGFFAFAAGTFIYSMFEIGVIPDKEADSVSLMLVGAVFPLELIAGLLAYLARDTAGGTAITFLAGSWLGIGLVELFAPHGELSKTVGLFVLMIAATLLAFALLPIKGKVLLAIAMLIAVPRYVLLGVYQLSGSDELNVASGIVGLVLVVVAAYGGVALLVEDSAQRTIWPIARRGASRGALEGDFREQLERLQREPGVRSQL